MYNRKGSLDHAKFTLVFFFHAFYSLQRKIQKIVILTEFYKINSRALFPSYLFLNIHSLIIKSNLLNE